MADLTRRLPGNTYVVEAFNAGSPIVQQAPSFSGLPTRDQRGNVVAGGANYYDTNAYVSQNMYGASTVYTAPAVLGGPTRRLGDTTQNTVTATFGQTPQAYDPFRGFEHARSNSGTPMPASTGVMSKQGGGSYGYVPFAEYGLSQSQSQSGRITNGYSMQQQAANTNTFFGKWIGSSSGTTGLVPGSGSGSPFVPYMADMGGQITSRSREQQAGSYADRYPTLYNSFVSGSISGNQLFSRALSESVRFDRDELASSSFRFSAPPTISFRFNSSGGSISYRGGGSTF